MLRLAKVLCTDDLRLLTLPPLARLAMFNKQAKAEPPPAPPKPKKVFKWKTSDEAGSESSLNVPAVPPPAPSPTPGAADSDAAAAGPALTSTTSTGSGEGVALEPVSSRVSAKSAASADSQGQPGKTGFSADDARATSGSLKDRIALLSGLKVDQPAPPGRAPKPWRKKTADLPAEEAVTGEASTAEAGNFTDKQPDITVDTEAAQEVAPGTDTPGEPITDKAPVLPKPASPTDNLANVVDTEVKSPVSETGLSSAAATEQPPSAAGGVALPSMPTRTRGPARKGRSGGTSAAASTTTSPTDEKAPQLPSISQQAGSRSPEAGQPAPSIEEISSPADGPKEFVADPELSKGDDMANSQSEASETAAGPPVVPPPPPPAVANSGAMADSDEEPDAPDFDDDDGTTGITRTMARQSTDEEPETVEEAVPETPKSPPPVPAASRPLPPMPARIDTNMTSPTKEEDQPLSPVNRRSMTRPPVPQAFQQADPLKSSPNRPSFEGIEARRQSSMIAQGDKESNSQEGEEDGGFANPAIDSADAVPVPPPVSKPIDTDIVTSPVIEQSPRSPLHSRQSSLASPSAAAPPPLPAGRPLAPPAQTPRSENTELETNIGAASAYRIAAEQPEETGEGTEEYEDPEVARRQALAKRMAAMGGMKIGMLPPMFGGGGLKRKPTLPREGDAEQPKSPLSPSAEVPVDPAPTPAPAPSAPSGESASASGAPSRPVPQPSGPSYRPPAGAFVLPGVGKPPAVPPPPAPEAVDEELEEEIAAGRAEPAEEDADIGDETVTQDQSAVDEREMEDEEDEEPRTAVPPPLPSGRPTRMPPPPTGQSFIDVDTDTDAASKRTSMTSMSTGVGDTSAFPNPPGADHVRTISTTSRVSNLADEEVIEEGQEADDEVAEEESPPPPPPTRPARAPPAAIDTDVQTLASDGDTQVMQSPVRTASMRSNQSLPQTPMSPAGRQASFSQMSPTASPSSGSRRSSTMVSTGGSGPAPPAGINHEYLAHLGASAARSKSKELDGALATALNEIAFSRRSDPGNFGHPVWRTYVSGEKGQAPDLQINGRIEAGCIFSAWDAKFDRGLGRSSLKVGSLEVPHVGIVCEDVKDIKKVRRLALVRAFH